MSVVAGCAEITQLYGRLSFAECGTMSVERWWTSKRVSLPRKNISIYIHIYMSLYRDARRWIKRNKRGQTARESASPRDSSALAVDDSCALPSRPKICLVPRWRTVTGRSTNSVPPRLGRLIRVKD